MRQLLLSGVIVLAFSCSSPRSEPAPAERTPLDLVLSARRGFVLDGDRLINDQPQWRAVVEPSGQLVFSAQPFAGHPAPGAVSLRLAGAQRGQPLELRDVPTRNAHDGVLDLDWGAFVERLETSGGHLEQSFRFEREPEGSGPLELTLSADARAHVDGDGAHFSSDTSAIGVRYGHGTFIDANGVRTPVPVRFEQGHLRLTVPAGALADAHYPAVLDPALDPEVTFPDGGSFVPAPRAQRAPAIGTSDAGWFVVWEDLRHALYRGSDLYGARVAFDGGVLDPNGIPLVTAPGDQVQPQVTFNGEHWVVAWLDKRNAPREQVWAMLVSPTGQPGSELRVTSSGDQSAPRIASNGAFTLITWGQVQLYGARLLNDGTLRDPNGFVLAPWPTATSHSLAWNGQYFVHSHEDNGPRAMFFDVDGGTRTFPLSDGGSATSVPLTSETNNALYGRTISLAALDDGRVAALWPRSNGGQWPAEIHSAIIDGQGNASEVKLRDFAAGWIDAPRVSAAFNGSSVIGCVTATYGQAPPMHAMTVSRLADGGAGPRVTLTTDAGVSNEDCAVGSGPGAVLAAYRTQHDYEPTLRFQVLSGDFTAPAPERVLSNAVNPQEHPAVARSGLTSRPWMIAWSDARTPYSGFDVYAQLLNNPGSGTPGTPFVLSARAADEVGVRLLGAGASGYVATWSEGNPLPFTAAAPKAMRLSAAGVAGPVIDLPYSAGYTPTFQAPVAALEGTNVVVTAGYNIDNLNNRFETFTFGLDFDGGVTRTALTKDGPRRNMQVAPHGGGLLAVWDDGDLIMGKLLSDAGTSQRPVFTLVDAANAQVHATLAPLADGGGTLVAWEDWRTGAPRVRATFFRPDGGGIGAGFAVSTQAGAQTYPAALSLLDGRTVIAWEQETDAGIDVFVTFIAPDGTSIDPAGVVWAGDGGASHNLRPVLASDGVGRAMLAWNRLSEDGQRLSAHWRFVGIGVGPGVACTQTSDCSEGFCVDGVCCNTACGGGDPGDCQACSMAAGASANGRCETLAVTHACRPARHLTCDVAEYCEGFTDCPSDVVQNTGMACDVSGTCELGACVTDAGIDDAGIDDAGAGGGSGGGGGGGGDDAGVPDAGEPGPNTVSHYSWNQSCGCGSGGSAMPLLLVAFAGVVRRRWRARAPRALTGALLLVLLLPLSARAEDRKPRLAFSGLTCPSGIPEGEVRALSEYLHTRLVALGHYEVIGASDIQQLLGLERQKQLLGCSEGSECITELAGALDADRLMSGNIARVGDTMVISLSLLDAKKNVAIHRNGTRVKGQSADAAFDLIDGLLEELSGKDPAVRAALERRAAAEASAPPAARGWYLSVGARVETDFVGIADGAPAVTPSLTAHFQHGVFGAAATVIIAPLPGVRAEVRVMPLPDWKVAPYLGAGGVFFGPSVGLRGALGVLGRVGPVQLFADLGVEGFVTGPPRFHPIALLLGAGAAWQF